MGVCKFPDQTVPPTLDQHFVSSQFKLEDGASVCTSSRPYVTALGRRCRGAEGRAGGPAPWGGGKNSEAIEQVFLSRVPVTQGRMPSPVLLSSTSTYLHRISFPCYSESHVTLQAAHGPETRELRR